MILKDFQILLACDKLCTFPVLLKEHANLIKANISDPHVLDEFHEVLLRNDLVQVNVDPSELRLEVLVFSIVVFHQQLEHIFRFLLHFRQRFVILDECFETF